MRVSDSTVIGEVEVISDKLITQLLKGIASAAFFSLASDKGNGPKKHRAACSLSASS